MFKLHVERFPLGILAAITAPLLDILVKMRCCGIRNKTISCFIWVNRTTCGSENSSYCTHILRYLESSILCSVYYSELILALYCLPPCCLLLIFCPIKKGLVKYFNSCNKAACYSLSSAC